MNVMGIYSNDPFIASVRCKSAGSMAAGRVMMTDDFWAGSSAFVIQNFIKSQDEDNGKRW